MDKTGIKEENQYLITSYFHKKAIKYNSANYDSIRYKILREGVSNEFPKSRYRNQFNDYGQVEKPQVDSIQISHPYDENCSYIDEIVIKRKNSNDSMVIWVDIDTCYFFMNVKMNKILYHSGEFYFNNHKDLFRAGYDEFVIPEDKLKRGRPAFTRIFR